MSDKDESLDQEQSASERRNIIKSIAVGGGAVATAASLPQTWTKPVLSQVVLPAHADMSEVVEPEPEPLAIVEGVYSTQSPLALVIPAHGGKQFASQYALLNSLISTANAGHLVEDICVTGDDDDDGVDDDSNEIQGDSNLHIRVNADMQVEIAIDSLNDDGYACANFGSIVSVTDGTTIPDVTIQLDYDEFVNLTNMEMTVANEISGSYSIDQDDTVECSGSFTVVLGGVYPIPALDCRDDD